MEDSKLIANDIAEFEAGLQNRKWFWQKGKESFLSWWKGASPPDAKNCTKLHLAKDKEEVTMLCKAWCEVHNCIVDDVDAPGERSCNLKDYLEAINDKQETALSMNARLNKYDIVMGLLMQGGNINSRDLDGLSALHWAIKNDNDDLVQLLLVFGADVNLKSKNGDSARHLASLSQSPNRMYILFYLHCFGADRCATENAACKQGCALNGLCDGCKLAAECLSSHERDCWKDKNCKIYKKSIECIFNDECFGKKKTKEVEAQIWQYVSRVFDDGFAYGNLEKAYQQIAEGIFGDRVLCMDGGGVRGLITIQMLLAIERAIGKTNQKDVQIADYFDWIGGTSTGGILSLAIAKGMPLLECQRLYFKLKDEVFRGNRMLGGFVTYDSRNIEKFLKTTFGSKTTMKELTTSSRKVMVTASLVDRDPAELHLMRNYSFPGMEKKMRYCDQPGLNLKIPDLPEKQLVWEAARATSAAPTYFSPQDAYTDGGLMSNNPTLDMLTEIHQHNISHQIVEKTDVKPLAVVVSLGTGRLISRKKVTEFDMNQDEYYFRIVTKLAKKTMAVKNLLNHLFEQTTQTEDQPFERSWAWCSMLQVPFFRFNPSLSKFIEMDCKDDKILINMLWETQYYLFRHSNRVLLLAEVLSRKLPLNNVDCDEADGVMPTPRPALCFYY